MKSLLVPIGILTLASFGAIGAWHLVGGAGASHLMAHCPLTMQSALCTMTVAAHLGAWQSLFAAVVSFSAVLLIGAVLFRARSERLQSMSPPRPRSFIAAFLAYSPVVPAPSDIQRALVRGVLHPKRFVCTVRYVRGA